MLLLVGDLRSGMSRGLSATAELLVNVRDTVDSSVRLGVVYELGPSSPTSTVSVVAYELTDSADDGDRKEDGVEQVPVGQRRRVGDFNLV